MSLPNYVVNFDELADLFAKQLDELGYSSIRDVEGVPKSKGFIADIGRTVSDEDEVLTWEADTSIILTSLYYEQELYDEKDSWEVYVGKKLIFETNYTHSLGDKKHWKTIQALNKGDTLTVKRVRHDNTPSRTRVWVNIEYIDVKDYMNDFVVPPEPERPIDKGEKK